MEPKVRFRNRKSEAQGLCPSTDCAADPGQASRSSSASAYTSVTRPQSPGHALFNSSLLWLFLKA